MMKNYFLVAAITALIAGGVGYYWGSKKSAPQNLVNIGSISADSAQKWVNYYGTWVGAMARIGVGDSGSPIKHDGVLSSWQIPRADLENLLVDCSDQTILAFLAFKKPQKVTEKFIDEIGLGMKEAHLILTSNSKREYYDLIEPCPKVCDVVMENILYKSYTQGFDSGYADSARRKNNH